MKRLSNSVPNTGVARCSAQVLLPVVSEVLLGSLRHDIDVTPAGFLLTGAAEIMGVFALKEVILSPWSSQLSERQGVNVS